MKRIERVVLHTFVNDYPKGASYKDVVAMIGSDQVGLLEWFQHCEPQEIREAMMYLMTDIQNLIAHEILEYDKVFVRKQQEANVAPH